MTISIVITAAAAERLREDIAITRTGIEARSFSMCIYWVSRRRYFDDGGYLPHSHEDKYVCGSYSKSSFITSETTRQKVFLFENEEILIVLKENYDDKRKYMLDFIDGFYCVD